jgi:spermidine synthase
MMQVLIIGGGDGGVAREVAKHPDVKHVVQCEIDSRVLEASRTFLPVLGKGLEHPKLTLHVGDGFAFMGQHQQEFDVIITDSSDPVGKLVSIIKILHYEYV